MLFPLCFFGWAGKNTIWTLKTLVGEKHGSDLNNEKTIEILNKLFTKKNIPLQCDNDEDIGVATFALAELKKLYPALKQPGVISCIVSESK